MINQWKVIKSEEEYDKAIVRFELIFDSKPGTDEGDEAELLALLIEQYDKEHFQIPYPDPIEAIKFIMEQSHLKPKDLIGIIGDRANVSKVLNKKRRLNMHMVKSLHDRFHIPYTILMNNY